MRLALTRALTLAAAAALVAVVPVVSAVPVASAARVSSGECPNIYFVGARGSGDSATARFQGLGPSVDKMASVVQHLVTADHLTFRTFADVYDADSVDDLIPTKYEIVLFATSPAAGAAYYYKHNVERYLASISTGIKDAVNEVKLLHSECPEALMVFAGYSQGAMVMHQAELQLTAHNPAVMRQVAGTLLLADGDRVPHTKAREFGTSPAGGEGVRTWLAHNSHKDVPEPATTANICNTGDIVCNFGKSTIKSLRVAEKAASIHTSYAKRDKAGKYTYEPVLTTAATWVAHQVLRNVWQPAAGPVPADAAKNPEVNLSSVACPSAARCVAAGSYDLKSGGASAGLLMSGPAAKPGAWSASEAPLPADADRSAGASVDAVACGSPTLCVAVGGYVDSADADHVLLLTWNGKSWSAARAPLPANADPGHFVYGDSVACLPSACVVTGGYEVSPSGNPAGMLLTGSGHSWVAREAPLPASAGQAATSQLNAVTCAPARSCTAVGHYQGNAVGTTAGPLTDTGLGSSWRAARPPSPSHGTGNSLQAAACASAASCVAAGTYLYNSAKLEDADRAMLTAGSGSSWASVGAPLPPNSALNGDSGTSLLVSELFQVSCPSTAGCVAVGSYLTNTFGPGASDLFEGVIVTGAGSSWKALEAPAPPGSDASRGESVQAVSCLSPTACVAVGGYADTADLGHQILLTGSGTKWTAVNAPMPADSRNSTPSQAANLTSIACVPGGSCTAVGYYTNSSGAVTGLVVTGPR